MAVNMDMKHEKDKRADAAKMIGNGGGGGGGGGAIIVLLKMEMRCNCEGCADKIRRTIKSIDGVQNARVDAQNKDVVAVKCTMDAAELTTYLRRKLNRSVEVVSPKKVGGGIIADNIEKAKEKKAIEDEGETKDLGSGIRETEGKASGGGAGGSEDADDDGESSTRESKVQVNINKLDHNPSRYKRLVVGEGTSRLTASSNNLLQANLEENNNEKGLISSKMRGESSQRRKVGGVDDGTGAGRGDRDKNHGKDNVVPQPEASSVVRDFRLNCNGCLHEIRKIVGDFSGVEEVTVTVKGKMEPEKLTRLGNGLVRTAAKAVPVMEDEAPGKGKNKEKVKMQQHYPAGGWHINPARIRSDRSDQWALPQQQHYAPSPHIGSSSRDHLFSDENANSCSIL